jgi:H/ACA ribonucleoprotein complex subunit 1
MGKDVNKTDQSQSSRGGSSYRGGAGGSRGGYSRGGGQRGGGGYNRGAPQGPPAFVIPFCVFEHPCENQILIRATDMTRVPKFNRAVYL